MASREAYLAKLRDPRWQRLRLQVMERDGFACRSCRDTTKTLNAHHSYYSRGMEPWDYPPSSIITLCDECHADEHANWQCDELAETACANGFWCVFDRTLLAGAINGLPSDEPLTRTAAIALTEVVEAFCWSLRHETSVEGSVANEMLKAAARAPSLLPGRASFESDYVGEAQDATRAEH